MVDDWCYLYQEDLFCRVCISRDQRRGDCYLDIRDLLRNVEGPRMDEVCSYWKRDKFDDDGFMKDSKLNISILIE